MMMKLEDNTNGSSVVSRSGTKIKLLNEIQEDVIVDLRLVETWYGYSPYEASREWQALLVLRLGRSGCAGSHSDTEQNLNKKVGLVVRHARANCELMHL